MLLLTCHLFSTGGYVAFYQYLKYRSDIFFNQQTSENKYYKGDLVEVRLPVNTLNITSWTSYEDIKGTIQFEQASYNFVKMKMTRHAIYLMCVPNYKTTIYSTTNVIVAKNIKDIPVPKKDHVPFLKLNHNEKVSFCFGQFAFNIPVRYLRTITVQPPADLLSIPVRMPKQPPKFSC
ncbi:MAG TPA: hypothetical protein VHA56_09450 [Mucilaginibacter sp.]|nr:hypothetical protein [Mucilaginibacter sp.]